MMTDTDTRLPSERSAQSRPDETSKSVLAVVGFDGSAPSRAALTAAEELVRGRPGHLEIVYVAHIAAAASMSASAIVGVRSSFGPIADDLHAEARAALDDREPRWHFQRRDGAVADELVHVADGLRSVHGADSTVVLVVGTSAHALHHVAGSVAVALTREGSFPVLVVPARTDNDATAAEDSSTARRTDRPGRREVIVSKRERAARVLRHAGHTEQDIDKVLAGVAFPVTLSSLEDHSRDFGISQGSLVERLGGSP